MGSQWREGSAAAHKEFEDRMALENFGEKVEFIWPVADLLRGPYRPNQYKDVMLPMTVLRRLDCVLEPTKDKVLARCDAQKVGKVKNLEPILNKVAGQSFHNTSKITFAKLRGDPDHIAANLTHFIKGFSTRAREILELSRFDKNHRATEQGRPAIAGRCAHHGLN
jgi:type I restriction enzyme M protein